MSKGIKPLCRMLIHGRLPNADKPDVSRHDVPVIEYEPTRLFGTNLPIGSQSATAEDFREAAEDLRAALSSDRDLQVNDSQAAHFRNKDLNTDVVKVSRNYFQQALQKSHRLLRLKAQNCMPGIKSEQTEYYGRIGSFWRDFQKCAHCT